MGFLAQTAKNPLKECARSYAKFKPVTQGILRKFRVATPHEVPDAPDLPPALRHPPVLPCPRWRFSALFTEKARVPEAIHNTLTGKVVRILDGDTVEVLDIETNAHRVRLAGIDAPETGQGYGTQAKRRLIALAAGKVVEVEFTKRDKCKRIVGKIIADQQDVNLAMVRDRLAWWYWKYAGEQSEVDQVIYEATEDTASTARVGLWRDPDPMPPWEWRHRLLGVTRPNVPASRERFVSGSAVGGSVCGKVGPSATIRRRGSLEPALIFLRRAETRQPS